MPTYKLYRDVVTTRQGDVQQGVTVTVRTSGGSLAPIYSDASGAGGAISGSALTTDANGEYWFYADDGTYSLTFTKGLHRPW